MKNTLHIIPLLLVLAFLPPPASGTEEEQLPPAGIEEKQEEMEEFLTLEYKSDETPLTGEEKKRHSWLGARIMKRVIEAGFANYILEGEVVDEGGTRLNGVDLRITKYKSLGPERGKEDREERVIDGTFSIKARGHTTIYLYFQKEGYYRENISFSCDDNDDPYSPDYNSDRKLDRRDIRIVMEKKGNITTLIEEDFKLIYRRQEDGTASGRVVNFDRDRWPRGYYFQKPRNPIKVANLLDPEALPPLCVYMLPKVDEEGRILSEDKAGPGWDRAFLLPKELRLISNDPEGGFIVYEKKEGERPYWSMKLAPESGYKQELVLDADWFYRRSPYLTSLSKAGIYFYFKINGRYGKGKIGTPSLPEGDYALEMKTEFRLQADGSRNLDTGRD